MNEDITPVLGLERIKRPGSKKKPYVLIWIIPGSAYRCTEDMTEYNLRQSAIAAGQRLVAAYAEQGEEIEFDERTR